MSHYDKYEPMAGGFRAPLAADWLTADVNKAFGVGLDSNGAVVKGAGASGLVGVLILNKLRYAGEIVDTMTDGEITEFGAETGGTPGVAGTVYYANATTGILSTTATGVRVGHTVAGQRLVVRFVPAPAA